MKWLYFVFILLLFSCSNEKKQQTHSPQVQKTVELPVFELYGELLPSDYLNDANPITEKYGFKVKRVAGCEVDFGLRNSVHRNNKKAVEKMVAKFGADWQEKFEKETGLKVLVILD